MLECRPHGENHESILVLDPEAGPVVMVPGPRPAHAEGRVPELWLIPPGETPNSLGIVSIVKSTSVNSLWAQGRYPEAQKAAEDAKKFAVWGAIAGVVVAVAYAIFAVVMGVASSGY